MRSPAVVAMFVAILAMTSVASAAEVSPQPSSHAPGSERGIALTAQAGGNPCEWEVGCHVGLTITLAGQDAPVLEGSFEGAAGSLPAGTLTGTLEAGMYVVHARATGLADERARQDPDPARLYPSCSAELDLTTGQPAVELTTSMAWGEPACGIVIEPRTSSGVPRPVLSRAIRTSGAPPRFLPRGKPAATVTHKGVRLDLWIKDQSLRQGQWLLAHVRVTNTGRKAIPYSGRFEGLACPPLEIRADTSDLFDPGRTWTGVAATFKERFVESGILLQAPLGIPRRARSDSCGDVGQSGTLMPGAVVDVPLAGMPAYGLRRQPLPPGTIDVSVAFVGRKAFGRATVSAGVTLAGDAVAYPSPGQLVDAALETPGFIEMLEHAPDPRSWANTHMASWQRPPYPTQPRLDGARGAPQGIVEIVQFLTGDMFVVGAVVDPWTAESFGAFGW